MARDVQGFGITAALTTCGCVATVATSRGPCCRRQLYRRQEVHHVKSRSQKVTQPGCG